MQVMSKVIYSAMLFVVFSMVGWFIDSIYRSLINKEWTSKTVFPFIAPIYGIGGMLLIGLFRLFDFGFFADIYVGIIVVTLLEYSGGVWCERYLNRKLWDYSKNRWNINGRVDLLHTFYWTMLVIILRIIFPYLDF